MTPQDAQAIVDALHEANGTLHLIAGVIMLIAVMGFLALVFRK